MASDRTSDYKHTFRPRCRLAPVKYAPNPDDRPPIKAQYFYASIIPIDDPLSANVAADNRSTKPQPRPFGPGDNNALEQAWLSLASDVDRVNHDDARYNRKHKEASSQAIDEKRVVIVEAIARKHIEKHRGTAETYQVTLPLSDGLPSTPMPACCTELTLDVSQALERVFCALLRRTTPGLEPEAVSQDVLSAMSLLRQPIENIRQADETLSTQEITPKYEEASVDTRKKPTNKRRSGIDFDFQGRARSASQPTQYPSRTETPVGSPNHLRPLAGNDGISGKPFVRVETEKSSRSSSPRQGAGHEDLKSSQGATSSSETIEAKQRVQHRTRTLRELKMENAGGSPTPNDKEIPTTTTEVAVGVSKLHMVSLPMLQMKPIYWSPVNDMAVVTRATWFYRDTMLPIPPAVANQLEAGFQELRVWTETWSDELRCAVEIGPAGEEKVSHSLWPKDVPPSRKHGQVLVDEPAVSADPFCAAHCFRGEAAAAGSIEPIQVKEHDGLDATPKPFANYHVIYKNERDAFLLKPSLKPSAYYGRRSVQKIMKGVNVGIHVLRGFDQERWNRIHQKKSPSSGHDTAAADLPQGSADQESCSACNHEQNRGQVTDLVLVAHGIGQKFAERVESFHFTHAINAFRRSVNMELGSPAVKHVLREGQNGMMILPLNWRIGLSFEEGGPLQSEDVERNKQEGFGLKDIEPGTIPAVRSMISDVMFDIPFYMSHHKGSMISALVSEANRVYRLWCRNNPGFAENGRVHLIGHSLGSAMAVEVLSRQPSKVPPLDLSTPQPKTTFFEFNTSNLFLAGSPAGFFLLLERGALLPRRGRTKPDVDSADINSSVLTGEAGTYGCIAVDNVYNVLAKEDPIAYLLNGAVDANYAASLKQAHIPSLSGGLMASLRGMIPGLASQNAFDPATLTSEEPQRPDTRRLPSQLELEVHDFTREEMAEKKAFLLNDNGQIDWYLRSGGGPLEIQYLNMLSAHTSYWTNLDFIRFLCIEVGREPGRSRTLPALRAAKATKRLIP